MEVVAQSIIEQQIHICASEHLHKGVLTSEYKTHKINIFFLKCSFSKYKQLLRSINI